MFKNLFRKKEQAKAPDEATLFGVPKDIRKQIDAVGGDDYAAKLIFGDWLKTVSRVHLLYIEDNPWYKEHQHSEDFWEAYYNEEWERDWPLGKESYNERIPEIAQGAIYIKGLSKKNPIDLPKLVQRVEGIQKKLDRVLKIIENTEVTMSAKTALKM